MPYLPYFDEDQEKKNQENGSVNVSGTSNTINQSGQNVSAPKPVQRSGSWTNLENYLQANKDNAANLGDTIADKIDQQGSTVRSGIQTTNDDFKSKVDQGTISNLDTAKSDSDRIVNQAKTSDFANQINQGAIDRFKEVSNAEYKGPETLDASQYYSKTQTDLNKANQYRQDSKTDEGRFGLLTEAFNRPSYSQGQKNLDNLLLTGNEQAKNRIVTSANNLNDLQSKWDTSIQDALSLSKNRKDQIDDARTYSQGVLDSNRNQRNQEIDSSLKDIESKWSNEYDAYNNLLSGYKGGDLELTREQAAKLGLRGDSQQGIYNLLNGNPASNYLDLETFDSNKVVSKDQFAQLSALDKLANQYGLANISKFDDETKSGTSSLNSNFKADRFGTEATKADANFNNYAGNTNLSGSGQNTQEYYTGLFGTNRNEASASTRIEANLADLINNGGRTLDGQYDRSSAGGIQFNRNGESTGNTFGDLIKGGVEQFGDALFNWDWSGQNKGDDAQSTAKMWASKQAESNFMNELNRILNEQGYANRIKIKD